MKLFIWNMLTVINPTPKQWFEDGKKPICYSFCFVVIASNEVEAREQAQEHILGIPYNGVWDANIQRESWNYVQNNTPSVDSEIQQDVVQSTVFGMGGDILKSSL